MKPKQFEHELAHQLRVNGHSYLEISKLLHISKSSAHLYASHIKVPDHLLERLNDRRYYALGRKHSEETKQKIREYNIRTGKFPTGGNSVHRKIEKEALPFIEERFSTTELKPEKIGNHWFDFCNDKYIIEYTTDNTNGISKAIKRFETIIDDPRQKFLITKSTWFGEKRMNRLLKTGAKFILIWF